jgi:enamine deaminase RidA (YjgF/YER057c/UK114 family)
VSVSGRLAELGIDLPTVVPPVAAYVPAKAHGDLVFTAGQLPMVSGALPATGKVGEGHGLVAPADANSYARQCALNALAAAAASVGGVDRLTGVVKVVGFVASVPDFTGQPGVINGASDVLGEIFGEAGRHARSAVGVPVLPLDSPVELELVVEFA